MTYVEEDKQFPVLTRNLLVLGQAPVIPNQNPTDIKNKDSQILQTCIQQCKEVEWKRWRNEYLASLREGRNLEHSKSGTEIKIVEVVVIKGDEQKKAQWKHGTISKTWERSQSESSEVEIWKRVHRMNNTTPANVRVIT